ncbi:MAG: hypothetical protein JWN57_1510 [Frankiales bacterium]|nr:hypothetical protein [Frankiales bacterium]
MFSSWAAHCRQDGVLRRYLLALLLLAVGAAAALPSRALAEGDAPAGPSTSTSVLRLTPAGLPSTLPAGVGFTGELTWEQGGQLRRVRVHVPRTVRRPATLVVTLHGLYQTVTAAEADQDWTSLAEKRGAMVAWAVGPDASWNAGVCCGRAAAVERDDVAYLDRTLDVLSALHPVHPRRVHLAGFSNGAMMAYRYACARPERIASVLGVAGTLTSICGRRPTVPVLAVHGSADSTVPVAGTRWSSYLRTPLKPTWEVGRAFGTKATTRGVVLAGFGHGWPTKERGGYDATARGWDYFDAHPRAR